MMRKTVASCRWRHQVHASLVGCVLLLIFLAGCDRQASTGGSTLQPEQPIPARSATWEYAVEGMVCQGCDDSVTSAITAIPGVERAEVSLKDRKARIVADSAKVQSSAIEAAIVGAGYKARLTSAPLD